MNESQIIIQSLLIGAINAVLLVVTAFLLSRFVGEAVGRGLLAIFLVAAAGAYLGFTIAGDAPQFWGPIESLGIVGFGVLALLGWRGSPYWLAAGWALHPIWDIGLHYVGPGHSFTPVVYAISCVSFDWVVAAYIVAAHRFAWGREARSAREALA